MADDFTPDLSLLAPAARGAQAGWQQQLSALTRRLAAIEQGLRLQVNDSGVDVQRRRLQVLMAGATLTDDPDHDAARLTLPGGALPRCSAFGGKSGIVSGAITTVDLTGAAFDPGGWVDLAANTITVPDEGDYEIHAYVGWTPEGATDPTTGTYRLLYLDLTPGYDRSRQDPPPPAIDSGLSEFSQETTLFEHLAAGTTIKLVVEHDATGNMIVGAALESLYTARLTVVKLG